MTAIRPAAVAGFFYPDNPLELSQQIQTFLNAGHSDISPPRAIIAPHAGYIYSGSVAGAAYASLLPMANKIHRVALFGPSHRVPLHGMALSKSDAFETPLGNVPLDHSLDENLLALPQVCVLEEAHSEEHSLEVQLPFLQTVLNDFSLVPFVVGECSDTEVAEVMEYFWNDEHSLIVVSSDLSHYHNYQQARQMDASTSSCIEQLAGEKIGYEQACGRNPVNGLLLLAKRHGLSATTLELRNSGDTAGPRDRVVGYGAYAFH